MNHFLSSNGGPNLLKSFLSHKKRTTVFSGVRFLTYKHLGGTHPLVYKTLGGLLEETAERFGDNTAYVSVYQNKKVTFREVNEKADALAAGLLELGIERGDRVGLWAPNSLEWYITSFALAKAGIISVYLNPSYQSTELLHCLKTVGVKMLITAETFKTQNYLTLLDKLAPEIALSKGGKLKIKNLPSLESVVCFSEKDFPGVISYNQVAEGGTPTSREKLQELKKVICPDDASNIQFTSGTTGAPKGAVLSHFHGVNNSFFISMRQELHLKDHVLCLLGPLFHAMGSIIGILTCLHNGTTLVVPETAFSPKNAAAAILKEKCTMLLGTPTMYVDLMKIFQEKGIKPETLESALTGGAFASKQLLHDMSQNLGIKRIGAVYGMTETGPLTFLSKVTDDFDKVSSTVGYIMDHTEAKVVDEKGNTVPWDTPGELWIRGYGVMKGYWNDEKKTKETITPEKWFRTGDKFAITEDGYGKIIGRIKDMIIRGGENIFPADIEEFLSTHPDILDVQVVGVPDKRLGEQVCACIRLKPNSKLTAEDVKEFCKGKIADFKIPHYIYFVDKFPKTSSGKVQKFILRVEAMKHLNLSEENP